MNNLIFSDPFYAQREQLIRSQIGPQLDTLKKDMGQFLSACKARLFALRLDRPLTLEELRSCEPAKRQAILSAFLYNDAYWRFEAAYLMLSLGMLNVAYSDLRSCLETAMTGHVIENLDSEAIHFLKTGKLNLSKLSRFVPKEYDEILSQMKDYLSVKGTHSRLASLQLGITYGPNTLEKTLASITLAPPQHLQDDFKDAAPQCLKVSIDVLLMFMFLMSKGTRYQSRP